jgi:hypothetical protein
MPSFAGKAKRKNKALLFVGAFAMHGRNPKGKQRLLGLRESPIP